MATRKMPWFEFAPNTFEIDEFDCGSVFLLVGEERALLLDTGIGIGDLRGLVEQLTDKPYDVAITHGHGDYVGGAGWFDRVWLNEKDWDCFPFPNSIENRREYAEMIRNREHKHYPYDPETDIRPWPKTPERLPLADGQVFDLGGRTVTAYECPGHTPGEMVFIDSATRILFAGDAVNNNLGYWAKRGEANFTSVERAGKALRRILGMGDRYDCIYNFHHDYRGFGAPLADYVLPHAVKYCEDLVNGTENIMTLPNPLGALHGNATMDVVSDDGKSWICFNRDGILENA